MCIESKRNQLPLGLVMGSKEIKMQEEKVAGVLG